MFSAMWISLAREPSPFMMSSGVLSLACVQ